MSQVIEMVHFKLSQGVTQADFLQTNDEFETFLHQQPGMQYRSLAKSHSSETYVDVVYWKTMEDAKSAQAAFFESSLCQSFMQSIDKESVILDHLDIIAHTDCGQADKV